MKFADVTFSTPAENLAADEALLELCEAEGVEVLRFWESPAPFVVVGYANHVRSEVDVEACQELGVPILRRCTGGGAVVQGPGCLNYSLTLMAREHGPTATVTGTNQFVMERHRAAIEPLIGRPVSVQGHTDLAMRQPEGPAKIGNAGEWLKFSGNAQRRKRRSLLFHGTLLHAFDLALISKLLLTPSKQPDYRNARGHSDFVANLAVSRAALQDALRSAWDANEPGPIEPGERMNALLAEKYGRTEWHLRA